MELNFKDSTRASIRKYVHDSIVNRMKSKNITIDVLASWAGITVNRAADIVLESANPTFDEVCMIFTALGLPLDYLVEHVNALPYFQRNAPPTIKSKVAA